MTLFQTIQLATWPALVILVAFALLDESCQFKQRHVAQQHCKTFGHAEGQWDAAAKRIRCFDVTRTEVEAK